MKNGLKWADNYQAQGRPRLLETVDGTKECSTRGSSDPPDRRCRALCLPGCPSFRTVWPWRVTISQAKELRISASDAPQIESSEVSSVEL